MKIKWIAHTSKEDPTHVYRAVYLNGPAIAFIDDAIIYSPKHLVNQSKMKRYLKGQQPPEALYPGESIARLLKYFAITDEYQCISTQTFAEMIAMDDVQFALTYPNT